MATIAEPLSVQARKIILNLKPEALVCSQETWDAFLREHPPIFNTGEKSIDGAPVHVVATSISGFCAAWKCEFDHLGLKRFEAKWDPSVVKP